jgi:hypothetical protein
VQVWKWCTAGLALAWEISHRLIGTVSTNGVRSRTAKDRGDVTGLDQPTEAY